MDDPLNLMRVMPTQGGQPCSSVFHHDGHEEETTPPKMEGRAPSRPLLTLNNSTTPVRLGPQLLNPPATTTRCPTVGAFYLAGALHPEIRVPFREISLAPTKTMSGEIEVNEPVRVYDTSGPWGDEQCRCDVEQGFRPFRRDWILKRGDVEEIDGREVRPIDDGFLSDKHARASRTATEIGRMNLNNQLQHAAANRRPFRAKNGARDAIGVCSPAGS